MAVSQFRSCTLRRLHTSSRQSHLRKITIRLQSKKEITVFYTSQWISVNFSTVTFLKYCILDDVCSLQMRLKMPLKASEMRRSSCHQKSVFFGFEGKVTFFSFPKNPALREQWMKFVFPGQQWSCSGIFVCSRDFSDEYFVNKSQFGPGFAVRRWWVKLHQMSVFCWQSARKCIKCKQHKRFCSLFICNDVAACRQSLHKSCARSWLFSSAHGRHASRSSTFFGKTRYSVSFFSFFIGFWQTGNINNIKYVMQF